MSSVPNPSQDPSLASNDPMDAYAPQRWTPAPPIEEKMDKSVAWLIVAGSIIAAMLLTWLQR